jgi:hypothetical protein
MTSSPLFGHSWARRLDKEAGAGGFPIRKEAFDHFQRCGWAERLDREAGREFKRPVRQHLLLERERTDHACSVD